MLWLGSVDLDACSANRSVPTIPMERKIEEADCIPLIEEFTVRSKVLSAAAILKHATVNPG